eukprot:CAMPEP_0197498022 /NCGR_PEP_ID=MMETSP1311-20131121/55002_1 /TAXON_ID=464262 /ORGANISM="Genus nov. species nov., Strain RCC856" /LENGTH=37 /DNA_ID= /DNA_START= /DNA_END= /DNA_ORIENTATION=
MPFMGTGTCLGNWYLDSLGPADTLNSFKACKSSSESI